MSTNDERLEILLIEVTKLKVQVGDMENDVRILLEKLILGNGKASLLSRMDVVENNISEIVWFKRVAIAAILTGAVSLVIVWINL